MFLNQFDILYASRLCKGLPVMHEEGLSVTYHDLNHDLCTITMTSQCKCDDVTHVVDAMRT